MSTFAQQNSPQNFCRVTPNRAEAVDFPSKHAWDLFMVLNHPAVDKKIERGQPDCSRPIGEPGTTSVWETWRNAGSEVYLDDGREPPDWNDTTLPDEKPGSIPKTSPPTLAALGLKDPSELALLSFHNFGSSVIKPQFSPGDGVFHNTGGFGETRLNRSTYEFVKRNCLWSKDGQQRYADAVLAAKKPTTITFPIDSIEAKAAWLDFDAQKIPQDRRKTYYTAEYQGKKYGLTALHILTKDLPNWFWATFHHVDAPKNPYEGHDDYGRPKELSGTIWENYVLGGTQIDFVTSTGSPTILSDHYVEFQFQRSSCMTCHSTATIAPTGATGGPNQLMALCVLSPDVVPVITNGKLDCKKLVDNRLFESNSDKLLFERGEPLPEWYQKDGKPYYIQTDFVWSIPFRGNPEKQKPPARCIW
jgi:hypothetical protein